MEAATDEDEQVDEVVVDAKLMPDIDQPGQDDVGSSDGIVDRDNTTRDGTSRYAGTDYISTDMDSIYQRNGLGIWGVLRWRVYPLLHNFFDLSFREKEREAVFQKEAWYNGKVLAFVSSLYLVINFILYAAIVSDFR